VSVEVSASDSALQTLTVATDAVGTEEPDWESTPVPRGDAASKVIIRHST
jgi:hypothetical protein